MSEVNLEKSIKEYKKQVEILLGIGSCENWKQRDFEYLIEKIFEKTSVSISLSTIKRIWNLNFKNAPQPATLNALANFLDYNDWNDFVKSSELASNKPAINNKAILRVRRILLATGVIVLLVGLFFGLGVYKRVWVNSENPEVGTVRFDLKQTDTVFPNSVIFSYDLGNMLPEELQIQQSWDKRMTVKANLKANYSSCIYFYPGFFRAKLVADGVVLKEEELFLKTKGWTTNVMYEFWDSIPIYIDYDANIYNEKYVSLEVLKENGVDINGDYYVLYQNSKDFGIDIKDLFFSVDLKNSKAQGAKLCNNVVILLIGKNGWVNVPISAKGCVSDIDLFCAEYHFSGLEHDLSGFGCNLEEWNNLQVSGVDTVVSIGINNNKVFDISWNHDIGEITKICIIFKGSGSFKDFVFRKESLGV